jgi:S-adenosylmethionine:tRNA ribosyltransferase-isomerase
MQRADFHFDLPPELIAQRPAEQRSGSRLLVLDGGTGRFEDRYFRELPAMLAPQDLLVFNDTRVVPARIHGTKESGGKIEILLERALGATTALVQARSSKALKPGARVLLPGGATACMLGRHGDLFHLRFSCEVLPYFEAHGELPLPPYVDRAPDDADRERYQTLYAREPGAVAAPTAGLHFDAEMFHALAARGVAHAFVTLHVGAGTFQPVRVDDLDQHVMHEEFVRVPRRTVDAMAAARAAGGRVIAVGTTVVRSLETAARAAASAGAAGTEYGAVGGAAGAAAGETRGGAAAAMEREAVGGAASAGAAGASSTALEGAGGVAVDGTAHAAAIGRGATGAICRDAAPIGRTGAPERPAGYEGTTRLFIRPGYTFRAVDAILTNFHLPESTLLMLCAAFVGRDALLAAYAHAVAARYRFFSYGDAMLLTPASSALERA